MEDFITAIAGQTVSNDLYEKLAKTQYENRILVINQEIDDCMVEDCMLHIINWNRLDKDIPVEKRKPIKIYINSSGGDVMITSALIDLIEQSRTPVWGINIGLAASAAYQIFIACHKRVSLKNGIFLQHDGSVSVSTTGNKARNVMDFFNSLDELFKNHVLKKTKMSEEFYDKMYDQEFWFFATQGKELGIVDELIGEDCSIDDIL